MHIHFICRGNIWRSRLAEAYARRWLSDHRVMDDIAVSSSGIEAEYSPVNDLPEHTQAAMGRLGIIEYAAADWTQTTQGLIDAADIVVFLNNDVWKEAKHRFRVPPDRAIVWHIPDRFDIEDQVVSATSELLNQVVN